MPDYDYHEEHKDNMQVGMLLTMYDKGAPKSVPNVHRIPMNSRPKFGQLRVTSPDMLR